jgi:hypothetical protein
LTADHRTDEDHERRTEVENAHHARTLFVSNDASRSGAPMLLLHFLRWLKQQHSEMPFDLVSRSGGPLLAEFQALSPTSVLTRDHERRVLPVPERVRRDWMLSRLGAKSHGPIYSNTVTNGAEVDVLSQSRRPVITHVHVARRTGTRSTATRVTSLRRLTPSGTTWCRVAA